MVMEPSGFLSTIQIAITLAGFLGSAFAADHFAGPLADALAGAGVKPLCSARTVCSQAGISRASAMIQAAGLASIAPSKP